MQHSAKVRNANLLDLLVLAQLAEAYAAEAPQMKVHTLDVPSLMNNLAVTILSQEGYLKVLEVDGKVAGAMWGLLTTMPWSAVKVAQDIILFVKQEYRGHGLPLIDDWINWSIAQGAKEVVLSTASGINTSMFNRLMHRKGFTLQGYTYSKEVN